MLHRARQLLGGRGRLLQRGRLLLGAHRQVARARRHLGRGAGNRIGAAAHLVDDVVQVRAHVFHLHQQLGDFIFAADRHALGDVARRNRLGGVVRGLEAVAHAAQQRHRQQRGRQTAQQHAQHEHQDAEVVAL
ncbi:hypothetical protein SDC9_210394 [bioreactor metagenome]|uniref:Uncharacterized protein n=1 Tax=bioreactor metagenome TaxID=1076179 RepID=A0A645JHE4_9ZZZZ